MLTKSKGHAESLDEDGGDKAEFVHFDFLVFGYRIQEL
jgi:hypothetical protein